MKLLMYFLQPAVGNMGVDLSGGDGRVAQNSLDGADVSSVLQKIGSHRVPQSMRTDFFADDSRFDGVFLDNPLNTAGSKAQVFIFLKSVFGGYADKKGGVGIGSFFQVLLKNFFSAIGKENQANL